MRWRREGGEDCCDAINNQVLTVKRPLTGVARLFPFAWHSLGNGDGSGGNSSRVLARHLINQPPEF